MTTTVRERPILFSGPMVRAILDGRKTQTRRVVNFTRAPRCAADCGGPLPEQAYADRGFPDERGEYRCGYLKVPCRDDAAQRMFCPHGEPGDRLWVRESLRLGDHAVWRYAADFAPEADPAFQEMRRRVRSVIESDVERPLVVVHEDTPFLGVRRFRSAGAHVMAASPNSHPSPSR